MDDLLTSLLIERYSGTWWTRRASEPKPPRQKVDEVAARRRRRVLAEAIANEAPERRKA